MSLYNPQYKNEQGNIVDLPINAKKLDGYSYNDYSKYYTTSSTTANAFLVTIPYVKELSDGLVIHCKFHASTTSGATLNVNNLGAKGIYYGSTTAITTQIVANNYVELVYSATIDKWVMSSSYDETTNKCVKYSEAQNLTDAQKKQARDNISAVSTNKDETISGLKTFAAPTNKSGTEQATVWFNTANGGRVGFGKEGPNSGTGIFFDQESGTRRLKFRASATPGAMVWEQPESGSCLYYDVDSVQFRKCNSILFNNFKSAGYLYTDSNGSLKKGTLSKVATSGSYNDLSNKPTIPVIPTNISAFTNDSGYITGINSSMVTTALGYTPGTSNFTGYTSSNKLSTDYINNVAGWTSNVGTVTSVSAGTGLSISGTGTVNPTVNIASTHKLLTTSEYSALNVQSDWNATTGLAFIKNKPYVLPVTNYTDTESNFKVIGDFAKGRYINGSSKTIMLKTKEGGAAIADWDPGDILSVSGNGYWLLEHWSASKGFQYLSGNTDGSNPYFTSVGLKDIPIIDTSTGMGDSTRPLYVEKTTNSIGYTYYFLKTGDTYAGASQVVLNGSNYQSSQVSFYAPTDSGTTGQFLKSNGSSTPTWTNLSTVATSGSYNDLTNQPSISNATITIKQTGYNDQTFTLNGNAATISLADTTYSSKSAVDSGTDLSLVTTGEKYTWNNKQDKISVGTNGQLLSTNGSSLVWTNDNRGLLHHNLNVEIPNTTTDSGWSMFNSNYNGYLLKSVRFNANSPAWGVGDYGSGIVFGGVDTKGVMSVSYGTPKIKFAGGNGSGPRWWIGLTGTSETTYNLDDKQNKISALGTETKPVYFSSDGVVSACLNYGGGTKVTLNGTEHKGTNATMYAPTTAGTSGYSLKSNGSGAPRWAKEAAVQISGSLNAGVKNNASITLVITNTSKPLKKGVWRYSGTYGVFLVFAPTEITTMGSPKTAYICGYVSSSISNNTSLTLVEV